MQGHWPVWCLSSCRTLLPACSWYKIILFGDRMWTPSQGCYLAVEGLGVDLAISRVAS